MVPPAWQRSLLGGIPTSVPQPTTSWSWVNRWSPLAPRLLEDAYRRYRQVFDALEATYQ